MRTRLAVLVFATAAGAAGAEDAPGLAGTWRLNRELSQDLAGHIKAVAGSAQMSGGPQTWATETWLPWKANFGENERLTVRDFLLAAVPAFESLEIEQGADEVRTVHGEAGSRRFYLTRSSAGTSAISGETVKRQARLQGGQLLLESKGKEGEFRETFSLDGGRLVYVLHLEQKRLEKPLDARLVYDRTE
ncbi:MAG TPA: hypothetical protein VFQ51_20375 [Vicinamibacteria bacterium]|nr:hypothetical protein [Vicinamibacteria bacterium]